MKIRAKDIAAKLGVSPATVSNALNGREGVSEELRGRIVKAAQEMGYDQGKAAVEKKSFVRLLIMKTAGNIIMDTQFFSEMLESIQAECHKAGLELVMNHIYVSESILWESQVAEFFTEKCAGIIVLATELDSSLLGRISCSSPLVALDNLCRNVPVHAVVMNNSQAGYVATRELYANGHRHIGFLASKYVFSNAVLRQVGYETALKEILPEATPDIWPVELSIEGAYRDMKHLLTSGRRLPTAFFACNDEAAVGAVRALQEYGLRVPEDISIIGVDDTNICLACNPQLTTVHVFRKQMGRCAVRQLLASAECEPGCYLKTEISVQLVHRGSVASPSNR